MMKYWQNLSLKNVGKSKIQILANSKSNVGTSKIQYWQSPKSKTVGKIQVSESNKMFTNSDI